MTQQAFKQPDATNVIGIVQKDATRRQAAYQGVFDEMGKTLSVLSSHPLLKTDTQFLGLVDGLRGVEDGDAFYDRVAGLQAYVDRVARAHGVAVKVGNDGATGVALIHQRPQHLNDPVDQPFQRTRLQVR